MQPGNHTGFVQDISKPEVLVFLQFFGKLNQFLNFGSESSSTNTEETRLITMRSQPNCFEVVLLLLLLLSLLTLYLLLLLSLKLMLLFRQNQKLIWGSLWWKLSLGGWCANSFSCQTQQSWGCVEVELGLWHIPPYHNALLGYIEGTSLECAQCSIVLQ